MSKENGPPREPIKVQKIRFRGPQVGPGMGSSPSAMTSKLADQRQRHVIEFWPWLRHFRLIYHGEGEPEQFFIHESAVDHWVPLHG